MYMCMLCLCVHVYGWGGMSMAFYSIYMYMCMLCLALKSLFLVSFVYSFTAVEARVLAIGWRHRTSRST